MDYSELAVKLLNNMRSLSKIKSHKNISEALHGEAFVLDYISRQNGDVLPGKIGQEMNVSTARIATALNSLENKGLITRQIDKNDRRKILIDLTQEGKDLAERHRQTIIKVAANMLELLGEHDANEYVRISGKLAEMLPKLQ